MSKHFKPLQLIGLCLLFGAPALLPGTSGAAQDSGQKQAGLNQVALSLEKAIPVLVSSEDYRSASNTAFLLATARSRLDQPAAACVALSQSLDYYGKAVSKEIGEKPRIGALGIEEESDGMAVVRARFGCNRTHSV